MVAPSQAVLYILKLCHHRGSTRRDYCTISSNRSRFLEKAAEMADEFSFDLKKESDVIRDVNDRSK